jgi:hypothetical protein
VEVPSEAMHVWHLREVHEVDRLEAARLVRLEPGGCELAERALEARSRALRFAVAELDAADVRELERLLRALLDTAPPSWW